MFVRIAGADANRRRAVVNDRFRDRDKKLAP
jgi:hypothetical protein